MAVGGDRGRGGVHAPPPTPPTSSNTIFPKTRNHDESSECARARFSSAHPPPDPVVATAANWKLGGAARRGEAGDATVRRRQPHRLFFPGCPLSPPSYNYIAAHTHTHADRQCSRHPHDLLAHRTRTPIVHFNRLQHRPSSPATRLCAVTQRSNRKLTFRDVILNWVGPHIHTYTLLPSYSHSSSHYSLQPGVRQADRQLCARSQRASCRC
jgi:hypothetical protein